MSRSSRGARVTILLVEDGAFVREALADSLAQEGFRVIQVATALAAIQALEAEVVDLLVTDATLPAMSGLELIQAARDQIPSLPALLISAYPRTHFPDFTDTDFLQKPFRPEDLSREVRRLLAAGRDE